jgi:hypothetical protein
MGSESVLRVPITSMRDIETARNALRRKIAEQDCWPPSFYARAAAASMAVSELILSAGGNGEIDLSVVEKGDLSGIRLVCRISWLGGGIRALREVQRKRLRETEQQLRRVTDDVEYNDEANCSRLIVGIWPTQGEVD